MKSTHFLTRICYFACAIILATPVSAFAQQGPAGLYIWDQIDPAGGPVIRELDETVPAAGAVVSQVINNAPEFEYANGNFYNSQNNGILQVINADTGMVSSELTLDFGPSFNNVVTALEYVDGFLYAGSAFQGSPFAPSEFTIVDLNTGDVSTIGMTGVFGPLGGLAYNDGVMYAIESGNQVGTNLYTIDLATGSATSVGSTGLTLTGLEFGNDGVLYALGQDGFNDQLFTLDPNTGAATLIGTIAGEPNGRSITAGPVTVIPEPSCMALLICGCAVFVKRRRRCQ